MMKLLITQLTLIVVSLGVALMSYRFVGGSDFAPILSTLQNISAAVFTLAGIWVAYIYPEAISAYTVPNKITLLKTDNTERLEKLVLVIFISAFVLLGVLAYNLLYFLFHKAPFVIEHVELFKQGAIACIFYLSLLQVKAVLSVMKSNIKFIDQLHRLKTEKALNDDL